MVRYILLTIVFLLVYYAIRKFVRSLLGADARSEQKSRIPGEEMVLDPECNTYVVKRRAVARHINGELRFFCSETCAEKYHEKKRT